VFRQAATNFLPHITLTLGLLAAAAGSATAFDAPAIPWAPRRYACPRTDVPPVIDGLTDDAAWRAAPWTEPFTDIQGPLADPPRHATRAAMCWDDSCFYVAARLDEPDLWATLTRRDAVIYHDNDFEVFIDPDGDNHLYGELEINALGTVWDLLLVRPYRDGGPAIDAWDIAGLRSAVAVDGTLNDPADRDRSWTVELAIPWKVLGQIAGRACPPAPGDTWRVNFSRVQWRTEVVEGRTRKLTNATTGRPLPEDNWVWSSQGLIAMHCPEMWGLVRFAGDAAAERAPVDETDGEQARIAMANALMPLYYRQQAMRETGGRYAATLAELGVPAGHMPRWPGETGADGAAAVALPTGWTLGMTGDGAWFRATLNTPLGTALIDHTGKLERTP
jgi:hypothetical protein